MGRWGELAVQFSGDHADRADDRPPSLEEFLEENHRLFTVIGMFGALSVYLVNRLVVKSRGLSVDSRSTRVTR
jgi:hypothetical protein